MNAPKFHKLFFNNRWVTLIILLIFIGASCYYLSLPENAELTFLGYDLPFDDKKMVVFSIFILGIFTNVFINLFTGALQKDEPPETKVIVPPINVFTNSPPENTSPTTNTPDNQKFFPARFFPDLKYFEGRIKLLNDLEKKLQSEHRASIHDISGIGKTFSTYRFAEKFQAKYEKIFFIRANKEEMSGSLAEAGVWLNPSLENDPDQNKRARAFTDWLEKNDKWLVIYDNVDLPEELKPYVPANLKGDCLFTSNFPGIANLGKTVNIEKLSATESKKLLFSRAKNSPHQTPRFDDKKESEAFEKIVSEIDGHPLALNTTGAFIDKNVFNFQKFARKLEKEPQIIIENEDGFDKYHRGSVLKAFSIAIDDISETKATDKFENSSALAREILNTISFIAPEDIPDDLLQTIFEKLLQPRTFFQRLKQRLFGERITEKDKEDLWQEIRLKLISYDLLKYDETLTKLTTHRLIQKVLQSKLSDAEQKEFIQTAVTAIAELFVYSDFETIKHNEYYFPHAIAVIEKLEKFQLSSEILAEIYAKTGLHLRETIKYEDAKPYFEKSLEHFRQLPKDEKLHIPKWLAEYARLFELNGEYSKAADLYKEALQIDEKTIGKEHPHYAVRLNNLALVYDSQGKYDEAIKLYDQALQISEKTIGKEHPDYATYLSNLALAYTEQGKYDEAIKLYNQALQIGEKTIGKEHPDYAIRLGNLAKLYFAQGDFQSAERNNLQALSNFEKSLGKEHIYYATCNNDLAMVYKSQGRYDEAIELYNQALQVFRKSLGENHPSTQTVKVNLEVCKKKVENSRK